MGLAGQPRPASSRIDCQGHLKACDEGQNTCFLHHRLLMPERAAVERAVFLPTCAHIVVRVWPGVLDLWMDLPPLDPVDLEYYSCREIVFDTSPAKAVPKLVELCYPGS